MTEIDEVPDEVSGDDPRRRAIQVQEFVYGTITVLIAIAGLDLVGGAPPFGSGVIILVGAGATWIAHAYSTLLGRRLGMKHSIGAEEIAEALVHALPIVIAALPAVLLVGGAVAGAWTISFAFGAANVAGIAVLAVAGLQAGRVTGAGPRGVLLSGVVTASIGIAIVAVELFVHHY